MAETERGTGDPGGGPDRDLDLPTRPAPEPVPALGDPFVPDTGTEEGIAVAADPGLPPPGAGVVFQDALFAGLGVALLIAVLLAFRLRQLSEKLRRQALDREIAHRESARLKDELARREELGQRDVERRTARLATENHNLRRERGELTASRSRLEARVDLDELTGLPQRKAFHGLLSRELRRALRDGSHATIVAWEVDAFADLNRTMGHDRADQALQRIAALVRDACRRGGDTAARVDAARFAAILPATPTWGALRIAERVRERTWGLALPHAESSVADRVTVSAGVAELDPKSAPRPADVLAAVEAACAEALKRGGNRVVKVRIRGPAPTALASGQD